MKTTKAKGKAATLAHDCTDCWWTRDNSVCLAPKTCLSGHTHTQWRPRIEPRIERATALTPREQLAAMFAVEGYHVDAAFDQADTFLAEAARRRKDGEND